MASYRRRVESDLTRWSEAGWVTPAGASAIRADLAANAGQTIGLANVLAILGAVLISFAVMSFVGANWQEMPRLLRLGLLVGGLIGSYVLAGVLDRRGMNGFANAAVLAGVGIFGGSIMLISQMYHMDGNPADFLLTWMAGALLAGVLLRSNPALAFALVLAAIWGTWEAMNRNEVFWPFLIPWALISAAFYWMKWRPGLHLSGIALTGFVVSMGQFLGGGLWHWVVVGIGVAAMAASMIGERLRPELTGLWPGAFAYGLFIVFCGLFGLQFIADPGLGRFIALAVIALVLCIWAVQWGLDTGNRASLWLGYIGFSVEVLSIYVKTVGTLLDTSLFFLTAGLIVCGLAALAYRLHERGQTKGVGA